MAKFIVFKIDDIEKVCNQSQLGMLLHITREIRKLRQKEGRNPYPKYLIVNMDEPYANTVKKLIEEHEGEEVTFD